MSKVTEILSNHTFDQIEFSALNNNGGRATRCEFIGCSFQSCLFAQSEFIDSRFSECQFLECDLSLINLEGSSFSDVEFRSSKVLGVDWTRAKWETRLGAPLRFVECALDHSTFIGLDLKEIAFVDCKLIGVDFRGADLTRADFSGADLLEALFLDTRLEGANFRTARNYNIHPTQNQLEGARFSVPEAFSLLRNLDIELGEGDLDEVTETSARK